MSDSEDLRLPITFGPCSNGEYDPVPQSPLIREVTRQALDAADRNARRRGMSRRDFLRTTCGAATTLIVLAACSNDEKTARGERSGGTYDLPSESGVDPDAARDAIGGDGSLVLDMQGHLLEYDRDTPRTSQFFGGGFPQADCGEEDPRACFTTGVFLEEVFARSDTTMAVLSAVPIVAPPEDHPLSTAVMEEARRIADRLCGDGRLFIQGQVNPSLGSLEANLAGMEDTARRYRLSGWKVYTHAGGPAWWLDDHEPGGAQVGRAFIDQARALRIPVIAVHKGFSGGSRYASPEDIGPAAAAHPDINFVVYHSGFETFVTEGPYTEETANDGINRLITSVRQAGIGPNRNVYAELGSTWWNLMRTPDQAAHALGKLLQYVGEDNVVWGTDSIWYGSPQGQIQAFRAFSISEELQERYGYPALTPEVKRKVLGANAARLLGVDPVTTRCELDSNELEELRVALPGGNRTYGPTTASQVRAHMRDHGWI